jgi:hypothetical protein
LRLLFSIKGFLFLVIRSFFTCLITDFISHYQFFATARRRTARGVIAWRKIAKSSSQRKLEEKSSEVQVGGGEIESMFGGGIATLELPKKYEKSKSKKRMRKKGKLSEVLEKI